MGKKAVRGMDGWVWGGAGMLMACWMTAGVGGRLGSRRCLEQELCVGIELGGSF